MSYRALLNRLATAVIMVACVSISGCGGGGWWPFKGSPSADPNRVPAGVTEYACAGGKRLLVRFTPDANAAWIIYPDREFRLDRVAAGERYTNGVSTLSGSGDDVTLDAEGTRLFSECKRKQAS